MVVILKMIALLVHTVTKNYTGHNVKNQTIFLWIIAFARSILKMENGGVLFTIPTINVATLMQCVASLNYV